MAKEAPKSWKNVEIEQECRRGWTLETIAKVLEDWPSVKNYAYILHDKDGKELHCHCMLKFKDSVPTAAILAKLRKFGVEAEAQQLEKCKTWEGAIAYLTHRNEPEKHQYEYSEVYTNFDVKTMTEKEVERKNTKWNANRANEIVNAIADGTIRAYNMNEYITPVEFNTYRKDINNANAYRAQGLLAEMAKGDRNMEVVFITGPSGVGKDVMAKELAEKNGLSMYRCSNSEKPFDDYGGQEVVVWSDARDNERTPTAILRLLDNHNNNAEHARYKNIVLECKTFIITSIKPLEEWYAEAYKSKKEDRVQLYRRVKTVVEMTPKSIRYRLWNEKTHKHEYVSEKPLPNIYYERYSEAFLDTTEKKVEALKNVLGALVDVSQFALDYVDEHQTEVEDFLDAQKGETPFTD